MEVKILSAELISEYSTNKKLEKILDLVKEGNLVLLQGNLNDEEESQLITKALKSINDKFSGIEIAKLNNIMSKSFLDKIKNKLVNYLVGDKIGITLIGPSKIIKDIKMDPKKIDILIKK